MLMTDAAAILLENRENKEPVLILVVLNSVNQ